MLINMVQDYGGISASRLEVLEERLRDDVIAELDAFGGRSELGTICAYRYLYTIVLQGLATH